MKKIICLMMMGIMTLVSGCSLFEEGYSEEEFEKIYIDAGKKTINSKKMTFLVEYLDECGVVRNYIGFNFNEGKESAFSDYSCGDSRTHTTFEYTGGGSWQKRVVSRKNNQIVSSSSSEVVTETVQTYVSIKDKFEDYANIDLEVFDSETDKNDLLKHVINYDTNGGNEEFNYDDGKYTQYFTKTGMDKSQWGIKLIGNIKEDGLTYKTTLKRVLNIKDDKIASVKFIRDDRDFPNDEVKSIKIVYKYDSENYKKLFD